MPIIIDSETFYDIACMLKNMSDNVLSFAKSLTTNEIVTAEQQRHQCEMIGYLENINKGITDLEVILHTLLDVSRELKDTISIRFIEKTNDNTH